MGSASSSKKEEVAKSLPAIHGAIQVRMSEEDASNNRKVKLLLLGSGECGKSTILKQMKIIPVSLTTNSLTDDI